MLSAISCIRRGNSIVFLSGVRSRFVSETVGAFNLGQHVALHGLRKAIRRRALAPGQASTVRSKSQYNPAAATNADNAGTPRRTNVSRFLNCHTNGKTTAAIAI